MINFLHTFQPESIAIAFGNITIHWYGLAIVSGIIVALSVMLKIVEKFGFTKDEVYNLSFYLIIFSIIGARIYAVFLELPYYLKNPDQIIAVWNGGLAIHGALIGGALAVLIYSRKNKQSFLKWADLIALVLPIGQMFGRWGNYFNQELFGRPTEAAWGIPIELFHRPLSYQNFQYFHPTFLYESFLNLINFVILFFIFRRVIASEARQSHGIIFLVYLINYSVIRIIMEFFRIDHTPVFFGIRLPILVSIMIIIASCIFLFKIQNKRSKSNV